MKSALLLLLLAPAAHADLVQLVDGKTMSGIVTRKTDAELDLQVDEEGTVTIASDTVKSVDLQSAKENKELKAKWRADRLKQQATEDEQRRYAESQRAKGLVLYEDEWMTPEEAKHRLAAREADERYNSGSPRVFMAREGTPSPFNAPRVAAPGRHRSDDHYYYFPQRSRAFNFKEGHLESR